MKTSLWMLIAWLAAPALASAAEFKPVLDQTRELITGVGELTPAIPAGAAEATSYTLPMGTQRNLLTEVPGKPFRQVDPPPSMITWWKMPFYVTLGLPRDLVDAFMGGMSYVPFISILDYAVYEKVPTQIFVRDPRDWHNWTGRRNRRNHGFYDGESWGWFPSANTWNLTHPSPWKARRNAAYNQKLQKQLDELNAGADTANQDIARKQLAARQAALEALRGGKAIDATGAAAGKAASERMIPYYKTAVLDDGSFALLVTSLAVYENSPRWAEDLLWAELRQATPDRLAAARQLLKEMSNTYKLNLRVRRALILADVMLGNPKAALAEANEYMDPEPGKPMRNRLIFETALAAGDLDQARQALGAIQQGRQFADQQGLMADRLNLAAGQAEAARPSLAARAAAASADAYAHYYLGVADLARAEAGGKEFAAAVESAQKELATAAGTAPGPILRGHAEQALAFADKAKSELAGKPELTR